MKPPLHDIDCPDCDGVGYISEFVGRVFKDDHTCQTCDGKGYLEPPENPYDRGDQ